MKIKLNLSEAYFIKNLLEPFKNMKDKDLKTFEEKQCKLLAIDILNKLNK